MDVLIVDGYNMIGAWDELQEIKDVDLGHARDRLIELLAEYQAYAGIQVIVVFDAHFVKGPKSTQTLFQVETIYTKENETADECIERLVTKYKNIQNDVYVATSDHLEQRIIFGRGALRKSARELLAELQNIESDIREKIHLQESKKPHLKIPLSKEQLMTFEKWRRRK